MTIFSRAEGVSHSAFPQSFEVLTIEAVASAVKPKLHFFSFRVVSVHGFGGFAELDCCAISPPIRQALPMDLLYKCHGALLIVHAKGLAIVVAEVKLVHVALQMLLAHALVNARKAALEDREVAFDRVRRDVAANVLIAAMRHGLMRRKLAVELAIRAELVRMDLGLTVHVLADDGLEVLASDARNRGRNARCPYARPEKRSFACVPCLADGASPCACYPNRSRRPQPLFQNHRSGR